MKLEFTKPFKFAHGGTQIEFFEPGQVVENPSERLYEIAIADEAAIDPEVTATIQSQPDPKAKPAKSVKTKA